MSKKETKERLIDANSAAAHEAQSEWSQIRTQIEAGDYDESAVALYNRFDANLKKLFAASSLLAIALNRGDV